MYTCVKVPEKGCAKMHTQLFTIVTASVKEAQGDLFSLFKPQECIHKCVIKKLWTK